MLRYFWPSDDEQLAGQWQDSHFDEDAGWWVSIQQAGAVVALAVGLSIVSTNTLAAQQVFSQSQDDPVTFFSNVIPIQEEYWQNPVPPFNWPQTAVITDDDVHPTYAPVYQPDEDRWDPQIPSVPASNFVQLPFVDSENTPTFVAAVPVTDEQSPWVPQPPPYDTPWTLMLFLDDGSTVPVFQYDEDFWANPVSPQNWPQPQQPFSASDEDTQVIQFVAGEDPIWLQLVQPLQAILNWPQQWPFEQNESTNLIAFTSEDSWQNPTPPVPASIYRVDQWAFEQTDATGALYLDLDEGLSGPLPAPVPASLALLQQWPFEMHEPAFFLTVIHEEDLWANPVAPVASYPVPAIYGYIQAGDFDEIIGPFPTSTLDELYASGQFMAPTVAPVIDRNFLLLPYEPEPEEIPAGSLVPFIPPPPPFCPLPPAGPDADISISTFSNFKGGPVLALFCRICMSKNPLVVRGDYAIWCQDCCAFVSKQDTYMGTTQAPGQFKARF
jgi:hypothetical protein